jgi:eukaryotic-like serine/threonine-protein kinase
MADDHVEQTLDLSDDGSAPVPRGFTPGASIGHFRIARELGAGGMGVVFEAYDPDLDRRVAIKVVRDREAGSAAGRRLIAEAQAMAKLAHPNVVSVHEVGTVDDQVFVVMELVPGDTLAGWLASPRPWRDIVRVFVETGEGLVAAHDAGIVHGDFKPANVLIDGRPRVADFGLARVDGGERRFAAGSRPAGTPGYMAPEQLAGEPFDARADQYAFAVALRQAIGEERVPRRIRRAIDRALSPDPAARFPTLADMLAELRASLRTRRRAVAAALAIAVASGAIAVIATRSAVPSRDDCLDGVTLVDDVWTAAARTAHGGSHAGATATRLVDDWADAWRFGRRTACAAEPAARAARLACLDGALAELRAQLAVWSRGGPRLDLVAGAAGLPAPAACATPARAPSPMALPLIDRIAKIDALQRAGRSADARPDVAKLVSDASALGDPTTLASALISAGTVERDLDALDDATRDFAAAAREAARAGNDVALLDAMIMQASTAVDRGRPLEAIGILDGATSIATRTGDARADKLLLARGDALAQAGRVPEAIADTEKAIAILEPIAQREPAARVRLAAAIGALASAETLGMHYDKADTLLRKTLAIEEVDWGPDHPEVGKTLHDLANNEARLRRFDDSRAHYERSRAILVAAFGERDRLVALTDFSIGNMELQRDRPAEARRFLDRALAELVAAVGADHPDVARIEGALGTIERDADRCRDAIPHFERALAIVDRAGRTGTDVAIDLTNLGACLSEVGREAEARPLIERSLALFAAAGVSELARIETNAISAELEWSAGHHDHAIELAKRVVAVSEGADEPYKTIHDQMQKRVVEWTHR